MILSTKIIAKIKFTKNKTGTNINIQMPYWVKKDSSDRFIVSLGLLGGAMIPVEKEDDIQDAITDTIRCIIDEAHLHGKGFPEELKSLGWQIKSNVVRFKMPTNKDFELPEGEVYAGMIKSHMDKNLSVAA
jgi:hypothetical protein